MPSLDDTTGLTRYLEHVLRQVRARMDRARQAERRNNLLEAEIDRHRAHRKQIGFLLAKRVKELGGREDLELAGALLSWGFALTDDEFLRILQRREAPA